jgi:RecB family endonuclease NucS
MSKQFDAHWLENYERRNAPAIRQPKPEDFEGRESELHEMISTEMRNRRWYFVHSRTDKRTTTQLGVTDFIVAKPDGVTLWVEVKRKGGKLSAEQTATRHVLTALNHRHEVVYSMADFMEAIK